MSMGIKVGRAVRIRKIFCGKGMWNEDIDSADQHKICQPFHHFQSF